MYTYGTSTSSSLSSLAQISSTSERTYGGIGALVTCSTICDMRMSIRSSACTARAPATLHERPDRDQFRPDMLRLRGPLALYLLLRHEPVVEHGHAARQHRHSQLVLLLHVRQELAQGQVVRNVEAVPKRELGVEVLCVARAPRGVPRSVVPVARTGTGHPREPLLCFRPSPSDSSSGKNDAEP